MFKIAKTSNIIENKIENMKKSNSLTNKRIIKEYINDMITEVTKD